MSELGCAQSRPQALGRTYTPRETAAAARYHGSAHASLAAGGAGAAGAPADTATFSQPSNVDDDLPSMSSSLGEPSAAASAAAGFDSKGYASANTTNYDDADAMNTANATRAHVTASRLFVTFEQEEGRSRWV